MLVIVPHFIGNLRPVERSFQIVACRFVLLGNFLRRSGFEIIGKFPFPARLQICVESRLRIKGENDRNLLIAVDIIAQTGHDVAI